MAGRYGLARRLDLWSRPRLNLGLRLDLGPVSPLRIVPPLHSVGALLLLSFGSGLCLDRGLHLDGRLRLLSLLSLLSLRPGLRLDLSLGLNLSGSRLNLPWGFAAASAFALFPARLPLIRPALLLSRIGRAILMLAAIIRLGPCCGRTRNQKGDSGRSKKSFHGITQSAVEGRQAAGCRLGLALR